MGRARSGRLSRKAGAPALESVSDLANSLDRRRVCDEARDHVDLPRIHEYLRRFLWPR